MNNYSQVTPITGVDQVGLIYDRPAAALPPNAFSDALNVRFRDGTVRKMKGEVNLFPNLFDDPNNQINGLDANYDGSLLKYAFFWPNPNLINGNSGYYVVITEETRLVSDNSVPPPGNVNPTHQKDIVYLVSVDGNDKVQKGIFDIAGDSQWQHTFFQGGFAVIINNTVDKPQYILDNEPNSDINTVPDFAGLPGWESYEVNQQFLRDTFNPNADSYVFDLGQNVNFDNTVIVVERINSAAPTTVIPLTARGDTGVDGTANNPSWTAPNLDTVVYTPWIVPDEYEIYYDPTTDSTVINLPNNLSNSGVDTITVTVRSRNPVTVRAGVIRAFGDFLVAGDLVERDENDVNTIIRALPGVIRSSDVAKPGNIPNNWNPFAAGVSTADEFIVSDTSAVTDMAEMQGNLYIYTPTSIKVLRLTGNASIPLQISPIANSLGCQTLHGVVEFDGKHFVVGSKDIYIFTGNPGSSESVSNDRVRRYLFNRINPTHADRLFCLNNKQQDEIWVCFPTKDSTSGLCNEALIWSYRNNTWTRRELPEVVAGTIGLVPGGGLPSSRFGFTFTGDSGSNGITNVGAYEVRMLGTSSALEYTSSDLMYTGVSTGTVYGNGRLGYLVRLADISGDRPMYADSSILPEATLTGPDGVNVTFPLPIPVPDDVTPVTAQDIWDTVEAQLEALTGWSVATLPTGYVQETGTVRLISSIDDGSFLGLRDVADIPFSISLNTNTLVNVSDLGLQESTQDATVQGVTVVTGSGGNDFRGSFVKRAIPTILGIRVQAPLKTGGEEMIFLNAGTALDYDPVTHTGSTNGTSLDGASAVSKWISSINLNSTTLVAGIGTVSSEMTIQPTTFSEESEIVIEARVNDTVENAQWIWDQYQLALAGTISLASYNDPIYTNPVNFDGTEEVTLEVQSTAPAIAGTLDTQYAQDPARTPTYITTSTPADVTVTASNESFLDVDRPWSIGEINPSLEYPILCARKRITGPTTDLIYLNKILAADIGWSTPKFDFNPRTVVADPLTFSQVITNNDEPLDYTSYVERKEFSITPDTDTETIHEVAMWASGFYKPTVNADYIFNRLQLRMKGTNNPGQGETIDLTTLGTGISKNNYFISESYKMDTRVHGRFLNYRITDEILDNDGVEIEATSNSKRSTSTIFDKKSRWEFSSLQPEVNKGGRR